jgi:hypothetical protein
VTFTLVGFNTVVRDGIELEANFTAPVNVQMRVGAIEETVTVSGASPVVDVQGTQRREVVTRDLIETLPTGRSYQTIAATLPAVSTDRFDVGGSTQMWQGKVTAYGGLPRDYNTEVDQSQYDIPFRTTFKLSGSYPLPGGFRVSGVFQSVAGNEVGGTEGITHVVTRAQLPSLTVPSVAVRLSEPGTQYLDRVNQVDISVAGTIPVGRLRVKPQIDLFNALNASPVLNAISQFGPSLLQARQILDGRLLRLGVQVDF